MRRSEPTVRRHGMCQFVYKKDYLVTLGVELIPIDVRDAVTIRPLFAEAATARSISPASRTSIGISSTPKGSATDWIAPAVAQIIFFEHELTHTMAADVSSDRLMLQSMPISVFRLRPTAGRRTMESRSEELSR